MMDIWLAVGHIRVSSVRIGCGHMMRQNVAACHKDVHFVFIFAFVFVFVFVSVFVYVFAFVSVFAKMWQLVT